MPDTKGEILYDSTYLKYLMHSNQIQGYQGLQEGDDQNYVQDNENVWNVEGDDGRTIP